MNVLQELGLSSYEERVYRALVASGRARARTVADRSDVPRGRVYDVLGGLENRGLVRATDDDPRRYVAIDPEGAVDRLLEDRLAELEDRAEQYRSIAARARSSFAPTPPVEGQFWPGDLGAEDAQTLIREWMSVADDWFVMATGPPYAEAPAGAYEDEYRAFVDDLSPGVTVRLLVESAVADELPPFVDRLAETEVDAVIREVEHIGTTFAVMDDAISYIDVPHPEHHGERFGFVEFRDQTVANRLDTLFREMWADAAPTDLAPAGE